MAVTIARVHVGRQRDVDHVPCNWCRGRIRLLGLGSVGGSVGVVTGQFLDVRVTLRRDGGLWCAGTRSA